MSLDSTEELIDLGKSDDPAGNFKWDELSFLTYFFAQPRRREELPLSIGNRRV